MSTTRQKRKQPIAAADPELAPENDDGDIVMVASTGGAGGGDDTEQVSKKQKLGPGIVDEYERKLVIRNAAVKGLVDYFEGPHIDVRTFSVQVKFVPILEFASQPDIQSCLEELEVFGPANGLYEISKIIGQYAAMPDSLKLVLQNYKLMARKNVRSNLNSALQSCYFGEGRTCLPITDMGRVLASDYEHELWKRRMEAFNLYNASISCPFVYEVDDRFADRLDDGDVDGYYVTFHIGDITRAMWIIVKLYLSDFQRFMILSEGHPEIDKPINTLAEVEVEVKKPPVLEDTRDLAGARERIFWSGRADRGDFYAFMVKRKFWGSNSASFGFCVASPARGILPLEGIRFYIPIPQGLLHLLVWGR